MEFCGRRVNGASLTVELIVSQVQIQKSGRLIKKYWNQSCEYQPAKQLESNSGDQGPVGFAVDRIVHKGN